MYFPNVRKPANKEANNYQERRRDYKKVWLTEKNSGMMWNESGEDCEKQQQNHDDTLCPPSLKIHRPEEHPEASARIWRNLKLQGGFWIHVTPNSTTVLPSLRPEPEISTPKGNHVFPRLWPEPEISTPKGNHMLKVSCVWCSQDRALEPAPGFTSQSYPNVHLLAILANQHTPQSFLELIVLSSLANLALKSKPQRAKRYNLHLALWLPESMCNRGHRA